MYLLLYFCVFLLTMGSRRVNGEQLEDNLTIPEEHKNRTIENNEKQELIETPINARAGDGAISGSNRSWVQGNNKEKMETYDNIYYDWGFAPNIFPGVAIPDARVETVITTDISCWDCDEEKGESPLLVRCDYTMLLNTSLSPKGFACIRYKVTKGKRTYNKARCSYMPSSIFEPCEEVVRSAAPPAKVSKCKICWDDGCNASCPENDFPAWLVIRILAALLCCCCLLAICAIWAKNYTLCCGDDPCDK